MQSLYSSLVFRYCCIIGVYSATQLPRYLFYLIFHSILSQCTLEHALLLHSAHSGAHSTYAVRTREVFDFSRCRAHALSVSCEMRPSVNSRPHLPVKLALLCAIAHYTTPQNSGKAEKLSVKSIFHRQSCLILYVFLS